MEKVYLLLLISNNMGTVAIENGEIVGYLAFCNTYTDSQTGYKEANSPLYGYGVRHIKRGEIIV